MQRKRKKEEKEKRGGKQKGEAEAAVGLMADYKNVNVAISGCDYPRNIVRRATKGEG